eukprot:scaffold674_cov126-Cylindrotheca_fusiformis.AAC.5
MHKTNHNSGYEGRFVEASDPSGKMDEAKTLINKFVLHNVPRYACLGLGKKTVKLWCGKFSSFVHSSFQETVPMKTCLLAHTTLLFCANAFAPLTSVKSATILHSSFPGETPQWYFDPWSGIKQDDFFPRPRAYFTPPAEAMATGKKKTPATQAYFPPPVESLDAESRQTVAALPETTAVEDDVKEGIAPETMPELDGAKAPASMKK